jgi:hypothetical protein
VDETRFGWFGLEEWRLEGVNQATAIYLGKVQLYDLPLSALALAAVGSAVVSVLGLAVVRFLICPAGFWAAWRTHKWLRREN